jgi:hypothetical protein
VDNVLQLPASRREGIADLAAILRLRMQVNTTSPQQQHHTPTPEQQRQPKHMPSTHTTMPTNSNQAATHASNRCAPRSSWQVPHAA